jgi:hypothetical protein
MGSCGWDYVFILAAWGGLNLAYLAWFFGQRSFTGAVERRLSG